MSISRVSKPLLVLFVLALLLTLSGVAGAQIGKGWFEVEHLRATGNMDVDGTSTFRDTMTVKANQVVTSTSATTGNASFAGTVAVNGSDLAVSQMLAIVPQTAISVTNGGIITPTGTIQLLTAAGNVTPTIAAGSSGDVVTLINTANLTITIVDTTGYLLSGNIVLGQWDSATLVWYGTSWIQVAESDN